jgi:PAS domain S-box-containing protein
LRTLNETLEQQVQERTEERERAWKLSQELLVVALPDGSFESVNASWTRLLGWDAAELVGTKFEELTHPDDLKPTLAAFTSIFEKPLTDPYAYRLRHKDETWRWFAWTGVFEAGKVYASGLDVTLEREQADALRQSQKMEAVGQLTGGLAHDFNNLLAVISGSLEMLERSILKGRVADTDRFLNAARASAKRAASLTHRLLAFSRRQTLAPVPTNINLLVGSMHELVRRTIGPQIELEVVGLGGLWTTLVDAPQLENALLNLCLNARDAMPDGGRLTIETANRWLDDRTAKERDLPPGQYVSLCVSDTGCGMPPDVIAKAFDPFFTTKPIGQGTGLGLSMIYGFARQSGGQVRIYSEVGQGTMVCIYIPGFHGSTESDAGETDAPPPPKAEDGQTVLVVDDEPGVRMLVTDVGLPGGLNGRQVADASLKLRPDMKVLFITGYAENAAIGNGYLTPSMAVMTKPFSVNLLANRIRTLIGERE